MSKDNTIKTLDSYALFLERFNIVKEDFYLFGIEETILPDKHLIDTQWESLKKKLFSNYTVYIRGAGRDAKGTKIYIEFYRFLFENNNIKKDPTNNQIPQRIIQELTGYIKNISIFNFQVSHIFGRTRNPLLFEAAWNIAFIPKLIDPLTGHETKCHWPEEYQDLFLKHIKELYKKYIKEYNVIIETLDVENKVNIFLENIGVEEYTTKQKQIFRKGILDDFKQINL